MLNQRGLVFCIALLGTIAAGSAVNVPSALSAPNIVACKHDFEIGTNTTTNPHQIGANDRVYCTEPGTVFDFTYTWWQRKNPNRKGGWKKITSVNYGGPYIWRDNPKNYWESGWRWQGCKKGWQVHVQETATVFFKSVGHESVHIDTRNYNCP
jgi:hypothetical protein